MVKKSDTTRQVDALTNQPVASLDWDIKSPEDYQRLRAEFAKMPMTPVLTNVANVEREDHKGRSYDWLLKSEQSGGTIALHRITLYPGFHATEHNHVQEAEFFYVLEGEVDITVGNQRIVGGPGTFAYVPPFATHAFKPAGDTPTVMLHWNSPGGHERLTSAMVKLAASGETSAEVKRQTQEAHEYFFHED